MNYTTLNLEEDYPSLEEALSLLKTSIEQFRKEKIKCVLVIHGYGSSGKGGIICKKAREWLKAQERNKKVKTVIFGENFNIFTEGVITLKNTYEELNSLLTVSNNGVTVVEL